jgi:two-component system sensor histidine kinase SenX3
VHALTGREEEIDDGRAGSDQQCCESRHQYRLPTAVGLLEILAVGAQGPCRCTDKQTDQREGQCPPAKAIGQPLEHLTAGQLGRVRRHGDGGHDGVGNGGQDWIGHWPTLGTKSIIFNTFHCISCIYLPELCAWSPSVPGPATLGAVKSYVIGYIVVGLASVVGVVLAFQVGRRSGRRSLQQRLTALSNRLGVEAPDDGGMEPILSHLEKVAGDAAEAVTEASSDAIRLRRALDTLTQGVIVCDENGEVAFRNARAVALMNNRHGDALAAQAVTELLENAWQEGSAERTLDLYGPPRQTLAVRTRLIDDGRRPLGVIAIIEDVSERRRLEEIRRDFVANVSHELKTPIGALGLLAETLTVEPDPEVAQRLASRIHAEAFRVSRIIDDLLDLSRIESEEAPPREPIYINLVMAEAVERVRSAAEQRRITIELDEPDPPVHVVGDRRQLVSAIHSLLENAVTFSYEDSRVTVSASQANGEIRLSVADSGVGIPTRDLERIFERFYRVDHGRSRSTGGTGLGLSIVRHVASNHQGRVEVDSREGEGSTFTLVLPNPPEYTA